MEEREPSVNKQLSFILLEILATGVGWILIVLSAFGALGLLIGSWLGLPDDSTWLLATILAGLIGLFLRWWGNDSSLLRSLAKEDE